MVQDYKTQKHKICFLYMGQVLLAKLVLISIKKSAKDKSRTIDDNVTRRLRIHLQIVERLYSCVVISVSYLHESCATQSQYHIYTYNLVPQNP